MNWNTEEISWNMPEIISVPTVKELIPNSVWRIIDSAASSELPILVFCIFVLFIIFSLLWIIFEKLVWKRKKYSYLSFYWMKKWLWIAIILFIGSFMFRLWILSIGCSCYSMHDIKPIYTNTNGWKFKLLADIIECLCSLSICGIILTAYYRLFRKFGWKKWYSVLWAIYFPIWIFVLWFGNFQYKWNELETKTNNSENIEVDIKN